MEGRLWPWEQGLRKEFWAPHHCCSLPGLFPAVDINVPPALGKKGIITLTSCTSGCHEDWFITVSAAIMEPSKEAAEMLIQSSLVIAPLLLAPVLYSWSKACSSISFCSLRCLGRAPPYCRCSKAQRGEEVKSSLYFPAGGRAAEAGETSARDKRVGFWSSSSTVLPTRILLPGCSLLSFHLLYVFALPVMCESPKGSTLLLGVTVTHVAFCCACWNS